MNTSNKEIEPVVMVEMERLLQQDDDGSYKNKLIEQARLYKAEAVAAMNSGLPPESFQAAQALKTAMENAEFVVERVWRWSHKNM